VTHKIPTLLITAFSRQELQNQRGREMKSSGKMAGIAEIERKEREE
jgi:hypothetical protein